jgi:DNA-binding transcriptional LysR family regulator
MDRLGYFESFLEVLDQGSLSAAARVRGISQPAISQQMTALEADFGTLLLQRTATGATATRAGSIVARHAADMVATHQRMRTDVSDLAKTAGGELRISISKVMADNPVGVALQKLHAAYPKLNLIVKVEDRLVDVVNEGYDLALRTGDIGVSDAIVRKIGQFEAVLVAAPSYLDRVGRPTHHSEMGQHAFVQYADHRVHGFHTVSKDGQDAEIELATKLIVDTPSHLMSALADGLGFARLPRVLAEEHIRDGVLEVMLPDYVVEPKNIYLVYPHRHAVTKGTRVVINAIYAGLHNYGGTHVIRHQDLQLAA